VLAAAEGAHDAAKLVGLRFCRAIVVVQSALESEEDGAAAVAQGRATIATGPTWRVVGKVGPGGTRESEVGLVVAHVAGLLRAGGEEVAGDVREHKLAMLLTACPMQRPTRQALACAAAPPKERRDAEFHSNVPVDTTHCTALRGSTLLRHQPRHPFPSQRLEMARLQAVAKRAVASAVGVWAAGALTGRAVASLKHFRKVLLFARCCYGNMWN